MINLTSEARNQSLRLCTFGPGGLDSHSYHAKVDALVEHTLQDMTSGLVQRLTCVLEATLSKLSRYDEGSMLAPILSLTYKKGVSSSGRDVGKAYINFVRNSTEQLSHKVLDELWVLNLYDAWYDSQMTTLQDWLAERLESGLHPIQLSALGAIVRKLRSDFELLGMDQYRLNSKAYKATIQRIEMEEAAASVSDVASPPHHTSSGKGTPSQLSHADSASGISEEGTSGGSAASGLQSGAQDMFNRAAGIGKGFGMGLANKFGSGLLKF